jgi:hypothetical protein
MLPEWKVFGFAGTSYWGGVFAHELGHAHGYWHGNPAQTKTMDRAMRRARRRYLSLRPGTDRVPLGDRHRDVLEALTSGDLDLRGNVRSAGEEDPAGSGEREGPPKPSPLLPDLDPTGEDDFLVWYLRRRHGPEAARKRRVYESAWHWWMVKKGYSYDESRAAIYSVAAGTNLAWLARVRGMDVADARAASAIAELTAPGLELVWEKGRRLTRNRWGAVKTGEVADLLAFVRDFLAEVGSPSLRISKLLEVARVHLDRGEEDAALSVLVAALTDARKRSEEQFHSTLDACAGIWAGRKVR